MLHFRMLVVGLLGGLLLGLSSCDDDPTAPEVGSVQIFAEAATLEVFRDTVFDVVVLGTDGREVDVPVTWTSRREVVVEVDEGATVTGNGVGTGTVVASAGGFSDSVRIEVTPPEEFALFFEPDSVVFSETMEPPAVYPVAVDDRNREFALVDVELDSSDPEVIGVTPEGELTVHRLGRVTVRTEVGGQEAELVVRAEAAWKRIYTTGWNHACAIRVNDRAFCWGFFGDGRLGVDPGYFEGDAHMRPGPVQGEHRFESLTVGEHTTCGLTQNGRALCWGSNRWGQLGTGRDDESCDRPSVDPCSDVPLEVTGDHDFVQLDVGENNTCGVDSEGTAWCWGDNDRGAVGVQEGFQEGRPANILMTPRRVEAGVDFVSAFAAGWQWSGGLGADGRPYQWGILWGSPTAEQTAAGCPDDICWLPAEISGGPASFVQIEIMYRPGACGLDDAGDLYCWGSDAVQPRHVPIPEALEWLGPNGLGFALCGLTGGGRPYCVSWESGGNVVSEAFALQLPRADTRFAWVATGAGGSAVPSVCGITADEGLAYCWHEGNPDTEPELIGLPQSAPGVTDVPVG